MDELEHSHIVCLIGWILEKQKRDPLDKNKQLFYQQHIHSIISNQPFVYQITSIYLISMNKLAITNRQPSKGVLYVRFEQVADMLPALRSDHFVEVTVEIADDVKATQLRFLMNVCRVLKSDGKLIISSNKAVQTVSSVLGNLGFKKCESDSTQNETKNIIFQKSTVQKEEINGKKEKLSIGFQPLNNDQEIDEDELLKNQKLDIKKTPAQNCADKPRACANCNCGRKDNNEPLPTKEELVEAINSGKPVSGCGKCSLGDSFRCSSCPYQGLPAFKPGDKLKLVEEGNIVVENGGVKTQGGKVKLEL